MTPIELMAFVVAFFTLAKLFTMLLSQKSWFPKVTKNFWVESWKVTLVSLIILVVSLYFLLQELSITQVIASSLFAFSLVVLGLAPLSKYMLDIENKWFKKEKMIKVGRIAWIVYISLAVWVLIDIFF